MYMKYIFMKYNSQVLLGSRYGLLSFFFYISTIIQKKNIVLVYHMHIYLLGFFSTNIDIMID